MTAGNTKTALFNPTKEDKKLILQWFFCTSSDPINREAFRISAMKNDGDWKYAAAVATRNAVKMVEEDNTLENWERAMKLQRIFEQIPPLSPTA